MSERFELPQSGAKIRTVFESSLAWLQSLFVKSVCVCVGGVPEWGVRGLPWGGWNTQNGLCCPVPLLAIEMFFGQASQLLQGKHFHILSELEFSLSLIDQVLLWPREALPVQGRFPNAWQAGYLATHRGFREGEKMRGKGGGGQRGLMFYSLTILYMNIMSFHHDYPLLSPSPFLGSPLLFDAPFPHWV